MYRRSKMHGLEIQTGQCTSARKNKREHAGIKRDHRKEEEPLTHLLIATQISHPCSRHAPMTIQIWYPSFSLKKDLIINSPEGYKKAHHHCFFYKAMVQKAGTWAKKAK